MAKRITSLFLALMILLSTIPYVMAIDYTGEDEIKNSETDVALNALTQEYAAIYGDSEEWNTAQKYIDCYRNDPIFELHYSSDPVDAIEMVRTVVNGAISQISAIQPLGTLAASYSVDGVPNYTQSLTYSCGTASALQVIIQQGGGGSIPGNTFTLKEEELIDEIGLGEEGAYVSDVRNLINKYTSKHTYTYIKCTTLSEGEVQNLIRSSFRNDCPVILHAIKGYLDYYPSTDMKGHYIVGTAWYPPSNEFVVNDCNYKPEYGGVRTTSMTSVYNCLHMQSERYLIYGT